jgi:hypothetical protein
MKNASKFDVIDKAILARMTAQPLPFGAINVGPVREESERLAKSDGKELKDAFRFTDRRLQALRKAGKIRATTKGWVLAESTPAA